MYEEKNIENLWSKEYQAKGVPSSFKETPSSNLVDFLRLFSKEKLSDSKALDIGCGKGRHSFYLAEKGYLVTGIDIVATNIDEINNAALNSALPIKAYKRDLSENWHLENEKFDIAIDCFCFKHLISIESRENYLNELNRYLKPKAYYLLTLSDIDDAYYKQFPVRKEEELQVILDPVNNIESILYAKEQILNFFSKYFDLIDHKLNHAFSEMHGKTFLRSTHKFVMQHKIG
ncbi:MAG: class I SAM-dependent methyltransferase [Sphingobacteriia bacterium]|nr:class I SAM-dependent methyltransferase [Sphingobacteriia bacterium]